MWLDITFNRSAKKHISANINIFVTLIIAEHWGKIKEYKDDHVHGHGLYSDICCGTVYQNAVGNNDPEKLISLVYHIDGAPAVKSKSMNLWPIQCFVVELPPRLRYCFSNVLVCGLSCSSKKPDLKVFQERFVNEIEQLQGFEVQIEVNSQSIAIERIALHGHLADLVAKAPSLSFCQFNGKCGCSVCLHPGERIKRGKGSIRIYPYTNQEPPLRTHAQTILHATAAERTGKPLFGVKGVSPLLRVIEVPGQVLLDYMHLVLAGEFLRRLNVWLNHQSDNGFLSELKEEVDQAMLNVQFPHDFNRKLRPVSELKRWKDRELQNLFLHASLPILKPFFPAEYFCHFALLVTAIHLLTNDVISDGDIEIAKLLIRSYQRLIPSLYGETEQTYTCHALGHLPDQVRKHGPLILHSSFVFEAMISHLKRQFHGTRGIVAQIVRNLLIAQNSGSFIKENTREPQEISTFVDESIMGKRDKSLHKVEENCFFILPFKKNPDLPRSIVTGLNLEDQDVHQAERMLKNDQIFHSVAYKRKGKSCSYIVKFQEGDEDEFGIVQYYLFVRNTGFAVIWKFEKKGNICSFGLEEQDDTMVKSFIDKNILGKQFQAVKETSSCTYVPCCDIVCRCVFVPSASDGVSGYVSPVLRHYQHD